MVQSRTHEHFIHFKKREQNLGQSNQTKSLFYVKIVSADSHFMLKESFLLYLTFI